MKRFRSFLLFSAVAALLAFAGSAWAATYKSDVFSKDIAKTALVSFDASFDVYGGKSVNGDEIRRFAVTLSTDLSTDQVANVSVKALGKDFTSKDKIGLFRMASFDKMASVDVFVASNDGLHVVFPIALVEVGSNDLTVTSIDAKGITSLDISTGRQYKKAVASLDNLALSGDIGYIKLAVKSSDVYRVFEQAKDKNSKEFVLVAKKANISTIKSDKNSYVAIHLSKDKFASSDLVVTRMIYSTDVKPSVHYGVSSGDASVVSDDYVKVYPFAWQEGLKDGRYPDVKVSIYGASDDKFFEGITFTRYVMSGDPKVHFEVGGAR